MKVAIFFLALTCGVLCSPIEDEAMKEFLAGNNLFSANVYKELSKFERGDFVVSPISAETILALAHEGARGETAAEFVAGLQLPNTDQKSQYAFKTFLPYLKRSEDALKLFSANRIYVGDDIQLQDSFKDIAASIYDSGVENINFAQNIEAAKNINEWVEKNTYNKIRNLLAFNSLDENTRMVLVNALYFGGEWVYQFNPELIKKINFYGPVGDAVEVDAMFQIGAFYYYDNPTLKAQFLELPYKGGNISLVIALPYEEQPLSYLEENMYQVIQPHPFTKQKVNVVLPKFKTETYTQLIPILENLGIKKAFHSGADFSGIASNVDDVFINNVIQKTYINFNEAGTDAAAAAALSIVNSCFDPEEPIPFNANRPFVYYITYNGVVTFMGRFNNFSITA